MDSEDAICREFEQGGLSYIEAIRRLERLDYESKDAERIVLEWADSLETNGRDA